MILVQLNMQVSLLSDPVIERKKKKNNRQHFITITNAWENIGRWCADDFALQ